MKKLLLIFSVLLLSAVFHSCTNQPIEFDDFEFQAVYFSYQYPVRTITFGEDFVDTSMDNEGKFMIMATLGGVYSNKTNVTIEFVVDNELVDGFQFSTGNTLRAMPDNYYQLASNQIVIPRGKVVGGVEVQLTDAFFADPLALSNNYVIPIRMISVENADTILSGRPLYTVTNPHRLKQDDWEELPMDFRLTAVKYINQWHGFYLRRGVDKIDGKVDGIADQDSVRRNRFVEDDPVVLLSSRSLTTIEMPVVLRGVGGVHVHTPIRLAFDENGNCVVSAPPNATDYSVTGSGRFVKRGEKNSWGNRDRDAIYLEYVIDHTLMNVATIDTLVLQSRGVGMETFSVTPVP